MENCVLMEVNATDFVVKDLNTTSSGDICKGVAARVTDQNITIAGTGVKF